MSITSSRVIRTLHLRRASSMESSILNLKQRYWPFVVHKTSLRAVSPRPSPRTTVRILSFRSSASCYASDGIRKLDSARAEERKESVHPLFLLPPWRGAIKTTTSSGKS